jgi:hypothetical protein
MEFRDYASKETLALLTRVLSGHSEAASQQLRGVRDALDAAASAIQAASAATPQANDDIQQLVQRLTAAAGTVVQRVQQEARAAAEAARNEIEAERARKEKLAAALSEAQAQVEAARAELAQETERADTADHDLDSTLEAYRAVEIARREAVAEGEQQKKARAALEKEVREARSQATELAEDLKGEAARTAGLQADMKAIGEARTALEGALAKAEAAASAETEAKAALQRDLDAARAERETLAAELAARTADVTEVREEIARIRGSVEGATALLDGSVRGLDELVGATTVASLFATLVKQLSTQFPRVALFRVKGKHLEGEQQIGFDASADVTKLVIPMAVDSLIARAAGSGKVEQLAGSEPADALGPFNDTAANALALPIVFQGETLAVVYTSSDVPSSHAEPAAGRPTGAFAKLLVRCTAMLVTRLSQELKALAELREYARLLIGEAQRMHAADIEAKTKAEARRRRLQETIDCARELYAQRAAMEGSAAAVLLEEQIDAIIRSSDDKCFAEDLGAVTGRSEAGNAERTAS